VIISASINFADFISHLQEFVPSNAEVNPSCSRSEEM
jgi:hypothetical protein